MQSLAALLQPWQRVLRNALQESLPAEIKFGMLDGNAVRFTSREA
jgi:hypothetical protein